MTLRRWEVWALGEEDGEPYGDLVARCFTKLGAQFAAHIRETDLLTPRMIALWNARWPDRKLTIPHFEVCRRP